MGNLAEEKVSVCERKSTVSGQGEAKVEDPASNSSLNSFGDEKVG